ncbi:hypothetical protein NDU88_007575 [Pleurodeles waltl]|uniref:Uncharacterized protein n=1 Tax=Pleurodeles waltl TaxID=8319 RepID=A0AAV7PPS7_PLEWA|nr:hypothetical protein NDU88_007575 [Pleurodeles waltl]
MGRPQGMMHCWQLPPEEEVLGICLGSRGAADLRLHLSGVCLAYCGPVRSGYAPQDRREYRLAGGERAVKDWAARAVGRWRAVDPDKGARPVPSHWTPERKRGPV